MRNISTGVATDCTVNVDRAKEVGETILKSMVRKQRPRLHFKEKNHLVTMGQKKSIKVDGEPLQINPQLLFQRLTTVAQNMTENVAELFQYELCSHLLFLINTDFSGRQTRRSLQMTYEPWQKEMKCNHQK